MKTEAKKPDWKRVRELIVDRMRFRPDAPPQSAYAVRYGNTGRFGADTHELTERLLKEAKSDHRKGCMKPITAVATDDTAETEE